MNKFSGIGRVGAEPTVRTTERGDVASFNVAIDSGYGNNKQTNWIKVSLFDKRASVAQYINKGDLIGISGEIKLTKWTDKAGVEQSTLELGNADVTLIGRTTRKESDDGFSTPRPSKAAPQSNHASAGIDPFADDVPF